MQQTSPTKSTPAKVEGVIVDISKVMGVIAAVAIMGMTFITVADVIGRYFFDTPIKGTWEIVGLLLVFAGCWGFAYCQLKRSHINVDVFIQKFPKRVQAALHIFSILIGMIGFSIISWRMVLQAQKYFLMPRGNTTDTLNIPYAPFMLALAIGAGVMVLILIVDLVHIISDEVKRK
jgi:TRAP-type C4-dicarboxylate transport system permease small subunit